MKKTIYESPAVEIVEVYVEQGFATSQQIPSDWEDM